MNWEKIKEKFPNCYDEIRELSEKNKGADSRSIIDEYVISKGYPSYPMFINSLTKINEDQGVPTRNV